MTKERRNSRKGKKKAAVTMKEKKAAQKFKRDSKDATVFDMMQ